MTSLVLLRIAHSCRSGTFVTVVCASRSCGRICCCKKNVDIQNVNGLTTRPKVLTSEIIIAVLHLGERFWTIIALWRNLRCLGRHLSCCLWSENCVQSESFECIISVCFLYLLMHCGSQAIRTKGMPWFLLRETMELLLEESLQDIF